MRHRIEIDSALLQKALESSGLNSKRAVVEEGLRLLVKVHGQASIRRLRGKIAFDGEVRNTRIEQS
jgi:Arc/MetJ family transcription regulator